MSLFGRSSSNFDKYLEQATSNLLLEPDWAAILSICDCIRQGDVQAKYAVSAIKKKLFTQNPHVALYALQVLESCVKNCGSPMHQEIGSRQFMEELRELLKATPHDTVKSKILELIQTWAHAFRSEPNYRAVQDTVNLMKVEGFKFPVLRESDAMFVADIAPDWAEGECCHRCRVQFSVVNRRHHCRNCGQIFCQKCSGKNSAIPKFGIEKEVRVCEACWEKLNRSALAQKATGVPAPEQSSTYPSTQPSPAPAAAPGGKTEQDLQEEEDLQLALALSKSEAETKEKTKLSGLKTVTKISPILNNSGTEFPDVPSKDSTGNAADTELARYLNRSYWDQKQEEISQVPGSQQNRISPIPSAPATSSPHINNNNNSSLYSPTKGTEVPKSVTNGDFEDMNECIGNLKSTLEIFVNRMQSNYSRGRPIANDTYVQSLFMNVTNMHSQLVKHIQKQDDLRVHFEGLQDKLAQARDARAALDALREEHRERLRQEAEEAERQRQIQMSQKLDIMRKKKQEYLQYQRQIAMQRMQEQEREMQLRHEQQKYHMNMVQGGPQQVPPAQQTAMPYPTNLSAQGVPYMNQPQFQMGGVRPQSTPQQVPMGVPSPHHRQMQQPQQQQQQYQGPQFHPGSVGIPPNMQTGPIGPPNYQTYNVQGQIPQPNQPEAIQRPSMHSGIMSPPGMGPVGNLALASTLPINQQPGENQGQPEAALISFD